uniref:ubiquitinyl hydrolase 1 n=1 Tax=Cricetulus griseus TaxID=10029 RepID=A0A8C2QM81_CRIGR
MESQPWLPLEANPEFTSLHPNWQLVDVYGMECAGTEEEEKIKSQGQDDTSSVYFIKQIISNAYGTIGLIPAIANNKDKMHFESGSTMKKFLEESRSMSPEEPNTWRTMTLFELLMRPVHMKVRLRHQMGISMNYMDGKRFPVNHRKLTSNEMLLEDAIKVCKKFMERDSDELRFNAMALSAA